MKTLEEIRSILSQHKNRLENSYSIQSLAIFGSCARNEQTGKSDVDILVTFNDKIGVEFIELADEIEALLGHPVDLISKKGIHENYLKAIQSDLVYV